MFKISANDVRPLAASLRTGVHVTSRVPALARAIEAIEAAQHAGIHAPRGTRLVLRSASQTVETAFWSEEVVSMPKFEVFTRRMVPLAEKPYVTIQKRGNFALNRSAHAALGEPHAVELLYDPDEQVVGLRAVDTGVEHAYPLRSQGGKDIGPYLVAGMAFTKYYGIDTTTARRFPATMDDDVLCVDLSQPGTVVSSNRKGRGRHQEGDDDPAADR